MPSAEIGATVGLLSGGPISAAIGGIAGAVVGALIGGAAGCIAGAAVGEIIDDNALDSFLCLSCDYIFSNRRQHGAVSGRWNENILSYISPT